jgi:ketopantoate reductase
MKKIGIIGAKGRTGTMFAFELKNLGKIFGIEKEKKSEKEKIFLKRDGKEEIFEIEMISESEFPKEIDFDYLFFCLPNPIEKTLEFYLQKIKEGKRKVPVLFFSQNGLEAGEKAISLVEKIFGKEEFSIFRIALFNPIKKQEGGVEYGLPIKIALAKISGKENEKEVFKFFKNANFKVFLFSQKDWKNLEYSKLFLNLIGMACAVYRYPLREGLSKKKLFQKEILILREYKKVVKKAGGHFLNFPGYPVRFFSFLISLPIPLLFFFRKLILKIIEKKREEKEKDLNEIDFYNGAVVKMGKKMEIETPTNEEVLKIGKNLLKF